jgi:hypothetical protein
LANTRCLPKLNGLLTTAECSRSSALKPLEMYQIVTVN